MEAGNDAADVADDEHADDDAGMEMAMMTVMTLMMDDADDDDHHHHDGDDEDDDSEHDDWVEGLVLCPPLHFHNLLHTCNKKLKCICDTTCCTLVFSRVSSHFKRSHTRFGAHCVASVLVSSSQPKVCCSSNLLPPDEEDVEHGLHDVHEAQNLPGQSHAADVANHAAINCNATADKPYSDKADGTHI